MMKKLILFSVIIFSGFLFGQNIDAIQKTVQQINQTKDLKIKTVPYSYFMDQSEVTDNGIELKGFYKNGKLKKMEHFVGLSAWKSLQNISSLRMENWCLFILKNIRL